MWVATLLGSVWSEKTHASLRLSQQLGGGALAYIYFKDTPS